MALADDIAAVIAHPNGIVRAGGTHVQTGSDFLATNFNERIDTICWNATINVTADKFEINAKKPGTVGADHILIGNESSIAAIGQLQGNGVLYSEDFSGCIWFLFRDDYGSVYGVHAYRSGGTYPDPMPYFNRLGAKLLYVFPTTGVFTPGNFGTVICNVTNTQIIIDFLETKDRKVVRTVDHTVINDRLNAPAIIVPDLGAKLAGRPDPVESPKKRGLKHRVAKFLLRYC